VLTGGIVAWDDLVTAGRAPGIGTRWPSLEASAERHASARNDTASADQPDSLN
jgi:adenylyltransferase/sulfurtransferase